MIKFAVWGDPKGKQRHRVGNGHMYTPRPTVEYEKIVKTSFVVAKQKKMDGQLSVYITALFKIPKSATKKDRQLMIDGEIRPTKNLMLIILQK